MEVTYQNGDKEILYFKDFSSGAMIENIVRRAKKPAVKREIAEQGRGVRVEDLIASIRQEYKENEDLPNTTNPDDWARISGKKGERIVYVRTLIAQNDADPVGGRSIEHVGTGQYLWSDDGRRQDPRHRDRVRGPGRSGPDPDPIGASSALVNAYAALGLAAHRVGLRRREPRARRAGMPTISGMAPMVETHLANTVLTNGARFYVDHAHPEYSSPECATPSEAVRYDVAGEYVLREAMRAALERGLGHGQIVVYKNNSDGKGNTYGCHENFLVDREVPFGDVVRAMVPHLVDADHLHGLGQGRRRDAVRRGRGARALPALPARRVRRRGRRARDDAQAPDREHPRRAPRGPASLPTAPHHHRRRQHVPGRDVPQARDDRAAARRARGPRVGAFPESPADPVRTIHEVSCDLDLSSKFELAGGGRSSALDVQSQLYELAERYVAAGRCGVRGRGRRGQRDPRRAGPPRSARCAATPRTSPRRSTGSPSGASWRATGRATASTADDPRLQALDLQYHDLRRSARCQRAGLEQLVSRRGAARAVTEPPLDTRAYFRGTCLWRSFPTQIVTANWDSLVFDLGTDPLRRVPMMDPLRGTAAHTEALLARCETAAQLLDELGS